MTAADEKQFATLQAQFALLGQALHRTDPADGPVSLYAECSGVVHYLPTLEAAEAFLAKIGGQS